MILYFIAFIYLLASRAGYITLVVIFFIHFIYRLKQGASRIIIVSTFVVLVIGLTFFVSFNRRIHKNIIEIENIALGNFTLNKKSDIRLWLWKAGLETIKENPWGIGTGDAKKVLDKKYETYNLKKLQGKHLNSHNQFIDEGVKLGYMGIIFMFSWMFYALYYAARRKNYLFFNFILILFINMFFEVILVRIAGVSFFVLFYSLLLIKNERISSH
ncbi:MAG: O-antigen ligase family protein [Bacteroidales bacterium]|nr:O-antigen ligase family protein [Bacteroidales bacterium]